MKLQSLMDRGQLWQAASRQLKDEAVCSSGYFELDQCFLEQGWPSACLTELFCAQPGQGEISLLLPLLVQLQQEQRDLLWLNPPMQPFPATLAAAGVTLTGFISISTKSRADCLWAFEQALRSGSCAAVLAWLAYANAKETRRLQLAAAEGNCRGFLICPPPVNQQSSAARMRIKLTRRRQGVGVEVIKRRGGNALAETSVWLPMPDAFVSAQASPVVSEHAASHLHLVR